MEINYVQNNNRTENIATKKQRYDIREIFGITLKECITTLSRHTSYANP